MKKILFSTILLSILFYNIQVISAVTCDEGYYLENDRCPKCSSAIVNCNTCSSSNTCTSCFANYYLESNNICRPCSAKANCIVCSTTSNACTKCTTGYTPNDTGCVSCQTLGLTTCNPCGEGYYINNNSCTICPAGSYCALGGTGTAVKCPANTYNENTGSTSESACVTCPAGTYSAEGASSCTDCEFNFVLIN